MKRQGTKMKNEILLVIGGIIIGGFLINKTFNFTDSISDTIAEFLNKNNQANAEQGLLFAKDKLLDSIAAAQKRGETIPPDILKRAGLN